MNKDTCFAIPDKVAQALCGPCDSFLQGSETETCVRERRPAFNINRWESSVSAARSRRLCKKRRAARSPCSLKQTQTSDPEEEELKILQNGNETVPDKSCATICAQREVLPPPVTLRGSGPVGYRWRAGGARAVQLREMDGLRAPENLAGAERQRNDTLDTLVRVPLAVTVGVPGNAMTKRVRDLKRLQRSTRRERRALWRIPAAVQTDVQN